MKFNLYNYNLLYSYNLLSLFFLKINLLEIYENIYFVHHLQKYFSFFFQKHVRLITNNIFFNRGTYSTRSIVWRVYVPYSIYHFNINVFFAFSIQYIAIIYANRIRIFYVYFHNFKLFFSDRDIYCIAQHLFYFQIWKSNNQYAFLVYFPPVIFPHVNFHLSFPQRIVLSIETMKVIVLLQLFLFYFYFNF